MKIEKKHIDDLKPAEYNPRIELQTDDEEYQSLKRSIEEFGLVDPIIYNEQTGNVVGGHQRLKVAKDLGYTEFDVSVVSMSEEKEKALNIALNKISGNWDDEKLKELLSELDSNELMLTGFNEDEIDSLMNDINIDEFFEEQEESNNKNEDTNSDYDLAIELLIKAHDRLIQYEGTYKDTDLYKDIGRFIGDTE
ncbi:MAG TPA: ParB N-terminal domain-containing protein [Candidatus Scybalomonas excrementigallinarum]|nr:ParB N-terminal domain-containing protein [Candidatus Scybalomonas excrementigallinarum]